MGKKVNKHKVVMFCITSLVFFVYSVGLLLLHLKTDDLEKMDYPLLMLVVIAIGSLVLISIRDDKGNDKS